MTWLSMFHKFPRALMFSLAFGMAVFLFLAASHINERQAYAANCGANIIYFTGHTPSNQYVNGVKVSGKIRHRGLIVPGLSFWSWSCIKGEVLSEAASTIDRVSWEGWKYEGGTEFDNWGSSCNSCRYGESIGSHRSLFLNGLGITIKMDGKHYFKNGASTLWLTSSRTATY